MDPLLTLLRSSPRFAPPDLRAAPRPPSPFWAAQTKGPVGSDGTGLGGQRHPPRSRLTHLCLPTATRSHFLTALFLLLLWVFLVCVVVVFNWSYIFSKEINNKIQLLEGPEI